MPDGDGTHIHIFESSQLAGSDVRALLYYLPHTNGNHAEREHLAVPSLGEACSPRTDSSALTVFSNLPVTLTAPSFQCLPNLSDEKKKKRLFVKIKNYGPHTESITSDFLRVSLCNLYV